MQFRKHMVAWAIAGLAAGGGAAHAAPGNGADLTAVPAGSDRVVAVPFTHEPVGTFDSASVSGQSVTLEGSPGFEAGALAGTHYVRVIDGPAAGLWSTISDNGAGSVTLADSAVAGLLTAGGGDTLRVYPHRTIGDVFLPEHRGVSFVVGTSVLFFDNTAGIQNLPAGGAGAVTFQDFPVEGWNGMDGSATVIPPDTAILVRNNDGSRDLTFIAQGRVPETPVSYHLPDGATRDVAVGSGYPVAQTVGRTNFGGEAGRSILLYDNTQDVQNLPAGGGGSLNYVTFPVEGWNGAEGAATVLPSAEGFLLRQNGDGGGLVRTTPVYPVVTD